MDAPEPAPPPTPPDYAAANREAVMADIETLPLRRQIEQAARMGKSITTDGKTYDFSGYSDADLSKIMREDQLLAMRETAPVLLDLQRQYGTDFVAEQRRQQEASDPEAFALRQQLGRQLQDDLALGASMTPEQQRNVQQSVRAAQSARGNVFSPSSITQEAFAEFDIGEQLKQRRQANAQAFAFGQPLASYNVATAQSGATPFQALGAGAMGTNLNPNAGQLGTNYAQGIFGQTSQNWANYNQMMMNRPANPLLGMGLGVLSTGLGAMTGGLGMGLAGAMSPAFSGIMRY